MLKLRYKVYDMFSFNLNETMCVRAVIEISYSFDRSFNAIM